MRDEGRQREKGWVRGIDERKRREAGELAKINIPYRAIASDNVDDRPELARQKASFSNGGEPMTIRGILEVCIRIDIYIHARQYRYAGARTQAK